MNRATFRNPARISCLTAVLMLALAASAGAAGRPVGRLGPDRPDESGFQPSREVFDCAFRDTIATAALDTIRDDTTGGENRLTTYACRAWTESGPEHVYLLEVTARVVFSARLAGLVGGVDLDLILLDDCDTDACLAQVNTGFSLVLDPGEYVLIVDGYQASAGAYTLLTGARSPGVPLAVCEEGGALAVAPPDTVEGQLFGLPDQIQSYPGCSELWHLAGETWYEVIVPGASTQEHQRVVLTVTPDNVAMDLVLWRFDGCGESALCLDFADEGIGGQPESLVIENQEDTPLRVLVAVDAFQPPAAEEAGGFALEFAVTVPAQRRSLGDVRSLFR